MSPALRAALTAPALFAVLAVPSLGDATLTSGLIGRVVAKDYLGRRGS